MKNDEKQLKIFKIAVKIAVKNLALLYLIRYYNIIYYFTKEIDNNGYNKKKERTNL